MLLSHQYHSPWSLQAKVLLKAAILFFGSFILFMFSSSLLEPFLAWVGQDILQLDGDFTAVSTGSGDRTMNYITLFLQVVLTVIGVLLWSYLDRKRPSYNQLQYWFTVILRIFVAFFMLAYGMAKVYKLQFPAPSLMRLMQPIGEMSPMGLAWTFMGHSEGYNLFTGFMEVLGGLLLIPRRTQTLGAFITMGVMTHVAMMNFFFDIPVKIFAVHLVLMAGFIFLIDLRRFSNYFIFNKPTSAISYYRPIIDPTYHKIIWWLKVSVLIIYLGFASFQGYHAERNLRDKRPKPELYGIWETKVFVKNNDTLPPLVTDSLRWRYLIRDREGFAVIKTMTADLKWMNFDLDSTSTQLSLYREDYKQDNNFTLIATDSTMTMEGVLYGDSLYIKLESLDLKSMRLTNRGFHWVNEHPYNY